MFFEIQMDFTSSAINATVSWNKSLTSDLDCALGKIVYLNSQCIERTIILYYSSPIKKLMYFQKVKGYAINIQLDEEE